MARMSKPLSCLAFAAVIIAAPQTVAVAADSIGGQVPMGELPRASSSKTTADHAKYEQLQREFVSGPEVTQACLECHTEAAKQIHKTTHWTLDLGV